MQSTLTPLERQLVAQVARQAQAEPSAVGVWVFGSRARGDATDNSDFDIAVEFAAAETAPLREWLERVRRVAEEPVVDQWPGFVNLIGLYAGDIDTCLARQVRAEGVAVWVRHRAAQS